MARCDTYIPGQCTWGACELLDWVPENLGDGGDWAANAPSHGLQVTTIPTVGAVVSYCRGDGYSSFGHCGVVEDIYPDGNFLVREMNFTTWNDYDNRVSSTYDVCGFILPPGAQPGQIPPPRGQGAGGSNAYLAWRWDLAIDYFGRSVNDRLVNMDQIRSLVDQL